MDEKMKIDDLITRYSDTSDNQRKASAHYSSQKTNYRLFLITASRKLP